MHISWVYIYLKNYTQHWNDKSNHFKTLQCYVFITTVFFLEWHQHRKGYDTFYRSEYEKLAILLSFFACCHIVTHIGDSSNGRSNDGVLGSFTILNFNQCVHIFPSFVKILFR